MKTLQKGILIFLIAIIFSWFTMAWFGSLYEKIIGRKISSGFWGPSCPECIEGFFLAYFLAASFLIFILIKTIKEKAITLAILFIPFFAVLLYFSAVEVAFWGIVFTAVGALLGFIVSFLISKIKKAQ